MAILNRIAVLLLLCLLVQPFYASESLAIHAIVKGALPIPRSHGPAHLTMPLPLFLRTVEAREEKSAIGQFSNEHRYHIPLVSFPKTITQVLADFYDGHLFRIELNYRPESKKQSRHKQVISQANENFGAPRINQIDQITLIFWDDGATRLIMQVDEGETHIEYTLTYIDDDLFHKSSRDRVQRETGGNSSYGK